MEFSFKVPSTIRRLLFVLLVSIIQSVQSPVALGAPLRAPFDHSAWDAFLKKFVDESGQVDYQRVKEDPALLEQYLKAISSITDPIFQQNWPREETLALWLNAYHAGLIDTVRRHYPVESVNDIPGFWTMDVIQVGLARYSLNHIREDRLLGTYRDEKIHLALSCGGEDCPRLSREAFTGPKVEGQLFLAARDFVNDPGRNEITPDSKKIHLSRIFEWHAKDFRLDFGSPENERSFTENEYAVVSFISFYLDDADKIDYLENGNYKIKYLPFSWKLNGQFR